MFPEFSSLNIYNHHDNDLLNLPICTFLLLLNDFSRYEDAENDCTEALNLDDRYVKAYSRRATARRELGKLKSSLQGMTQPFSFA